MKYSRCDWGKRNAVYRLTSLSAPATQGKFASTSTDTALPLIARDFACDVSICRGHTLAPKVIVGGKSTVFAHPHSARSTGIVSRAETFAGRIELLQQGRDCLGGLLRR